MFEVGQEKTTLFFTKSKRDFDNMEQTRNYNTNEGCSVVSGTAEKRSQELLTLSVLRKIRTLKKRENIKLKHK
jgi:hypothetical protein